MTYIYYSYNEEPDCENWSANVVGSFTIYADDTALKQGGFFDRSFSYPMASATASTSVIYPAELRAELYVIHEGGGLAAETTAASWGPN